MAQYSTELSIIGSVASILGLIISLISLSRTKHWVGIIGVVLLAVGASIFFYLYNQEKRSDVPPFLAITVDSIQSQDSADIVEHVSQESTNEIFSEAAHFSIVARGRVSGANVSTITQPLMAYALVHPPTVEQQWFVHKRERDYVTKEGRFEVVAFLGGTGSASAKHNQDFKLVIMVTTEEPRQDIYSTLTSLPPGHLISDVYKIRTLRKREDHGKQPSQ